MSFSIEYLKSSKYVLVSLGLVEPGVSEPRTFALLDWVQAARTHTHLQESMSSCGLQANGAKNLQGSIMVKRYFPHFSNCDAMLKESASPKSPANMYTLCDRPPLDAQDLRQRKNEEGT